VDLFAGAVGWGLDRDVSQIYDFISNNYEHGDEIFLFGFSRGAYTVRSVAGLVCNVGILSAINMARFPEMWKEYMSNEKQPFKESTWYKDNEENLGLVHAKIKIVGVFDTVGSLVC
jgi:uncharacterized protein (DUF2235 family)